MTTRALLTGNAAAAWGARLADIDYLPAFPITPQTEIIELLVQWTSEQVMLSCFVIMYSEHSMLTAAGAAARATKRWRFSTRAWHQERGHYLHRDRDGAVSRS